jgi:putative Holliday junction resolvase
MRLLGIDYGEKRIGLAIGETEDGLAVDYAVIEAESEKEVILEIKKVIDAEKVQSIVIGLPKGLTGKDTIQTEKVWQFGQILRESLALPIRYFDERFTTASFRSLRKKDLSGKRIDALSAAVILQGYIDAEKHH